MIKVIKYSLYYALIMFIGHYLKVMGLPSIFSLPFFILIPYNYLAILFGIKKPIEKNNDLNYKANLKYFIIFTSLIIVILYFVVNLSTGMSLGLLIFLLITNIIELYLTKIRNENIKDITTTNIKNYFNEKK
jgi:hypothetical protein